jgi:hypothetical protein
LLLRWREAARCTRPTGDHGRGVSEHRLRGCGRGSACLHRRHRPSARSAGWCIHQHRRAAIRARPCWSRHSIPLWLPTVS